MTLLVRTSAAFLALASAGAFALPAAAQDTEMTFMVDLQPAEGVDSPAIGMADFTVDPESMTLRWQMVYEGLSGDPVAAHFHGPAGPDETAPPVIDMTTDIMGAELTDEPLPTDILAGSAELTEEQLAELQAGMYYINVHTEQYPDGEIRGQVVEGEADMEAMEAIGATMGDAAGEAPEGAEAVAMVGDVEAGENLYKEVCRACHGPKAAGMASFPRLTGYDAAYLVERLQQYHAGETVGPNSALMIPVAQDLSDDDMANVAAYIAATFE